MQQNENIFDFGFTTSTEEELAAPALEKVTQESASVSEKLQDALAKQTDLQNRLSKLYDAVQPLLTNLRANPEKDYIHWPNRTEKIDAFWAMLTDIYNGKK